MAKTKKGHGNRIKNMFQMKQDILTQQSWHDWLIPVDILNLDAGYVLTWGDILIPKVAY